MGDELGGEGVVFVHEVEVGLEGGRGVGGGSGGLEDAGVVGGEVRGDGAGEGREGGRVRGVDGDDEAAGFARGGCGARGCEGGRDFGEDFDFAEGGDGEDHCFEGLGLRVDAHVVVVVAAAVAGLGVLEWGEGEGVLGVVLGVVWAWRWAHCEGAADAGTHQVGTGERLATLACGERERRGWIVDCSHRGVGSVGDTTTLGIRASWRTLARFRTLEAW